MEIPDTREYFSPGTVAIRDVTTTTTGVIAVKPIGIPLSKSNKFVSHQRGKKPRNHYGTVTLVCNCHIMILQLATDAEGSFYLQKVKKKHYTTVSNVNVAIPT
ncbi:hypothetical protein RUM44_006163 [Polyplax serrata]|uniref:Uncharacterized protein n=1 Tax=Polyplax serrata TaxID=468196 RepID=A0ABR1AZ97_POLSC